MAATAQTLDCELAMVIVEDCLKGSVLDFLMQTVMCYRLVMFGKKAMSSRVRCTLHVSSLHLKKPKKAKEKAAQSITENDIEGTNGGEECENPFEDKKGNGQMVASG